MGSIPKSQKKKCHAIIHAASAAAGGVGAGLAQLPGSDAPAIVAIQVTMTVSLGLVFGIKIEKSQAKALVLTALAATSGPVIARVATQFLIGWIPGVGNVVNAATAAAITEAIGWVIADQFNKDSMEKKRASEE